MANLQIIRALRIGSRINNSISGGILFTDSNSKIAQDSTNFFWDDSNNRLGLLTNAPVVTFDIRGSLNVGVDGTGHDVTFFGVTPGKSFLWDASLDGVRLEGTMGVGVNPIISSSLTLNQDITRGINIAGDYETPINITSTLTNTEKLLDLSPTITNTDAKGEVNFLEIGPLITGTENVTTVNGNINTARFNSDGITTNLHLMRSNSIIGSTVNNIDSFLSDASYFTFSFLGLAGITENFNGIRLLAPTDAASPSILTNYKAINIENECLFATNQWALYSTMDHPARFIGDIQIEADNRKLSIGATLNTDSYLQFDSSNLEIFSSGAVNLNGGIIKKIRTITSDDTLTANDHTIVIDASSNTVDAKLPPSPDGGQVLLIKVKDDTNTVTLDGNGKNIDDVATETMSLHEIIRVQYDDIDTWWII